MNFNNLESVKAPICPFCGHEVDVSSFRDDLSVKEKDVKMRSLAIALVLIVMERIATIAPLLNSFLNGKVNLFRRY